MSKWIVIAIDWTGKSDCEQCKSAADSTIEQLKVEKLGNCNPKCESAVVSGSVMLSLTGADVATESALVRLDEPWRTYVLAFNSEADARTWRETWKGCFDYLQLLSPNAC